MTDRNALAAGHHAVVASGAGNVAMARYAATAEVTWRRLDRLGAHAEVTWKPSREGVEHVLVTASPVQVLTYRCRS